MCNLAWTPPFLGKDNPKINPVYNTKNMSPHSIGRRIICQQVIFTEITRQIVITDLPRADAVHLHKGRNNQFTNNVSTLLHLSHSQ